MKPINLTLEESTALLAAIVDSSDDAIVSKTLDGVIMSWNRGAERIFGYTAEEAIGQHIKMIIPLERHPEEDNVLAQIRRGEKVDHFQTVRQAKDGRRLDISLTVSPVRDANGKVIGASKVARDISYQKRVEAQEQALRQSAEEANRLKDEFLATVSHELRNPLNSIVGWAQLLRSGRLDEKVTNRAIEAIASAAHAQEQIISDLLDVSRIISGRLRLDVRPLQLIEVLANAINALRPAVEAKQIRLQQLLDPNASPMSGDPDRLQQIFWNLLSNAVKFTPKGGWIRILSQRINSHVEIIVSDNGIGIEPNFLPFVFDRFRQGDPGTNRQTAGLGLGLSIVRNLVELHGGTVHADSKGAGEGASFTVKLPILIAPADVAGEDRVHPTAHELNTSTGGPSLKGLKILVVDDEDGAREIATIILTGAEAEVRSAANAIAALEIMDTWLPDVLVADIGMPEIDGYDFIRQVRARDSEKGGMVPAIALTAFARTQDRLRVLSSGYQMHVPKPVQPDELVTVVASVARR
jgi:PAS domain S-box-containing protein